NLITDTLKDVRDQLPWPLNALPDDLVQKAADYATEKIGDLGDVLIATAVYILILIGLFVLYWVLVAAVAVATGPLAIVLVGYEFEAGMVFAQLSTAAGWGAFTVLFNTFREAHQKAIQKTDEFITWVVNNTCDPNALTGPGVGAKISAPGAPV